MKDITVTKFLKKISIIITLYIISTASWGVKLSILDAKSVQLEGANPQLPKKQSFSGYTKAENLAEKVQQAIERGELTAEKDVCFGSDFFITTAYLAEAEFSIKGSLSTQTVIIIQDNNRRFFLKFQTPEFKKNTKNIKFTVQHSGLITGLIWGTPHLVFGGK